MEWVARMLVCSEAGGVEGAGEGNGHLWVVRSAVLNAVRMDCQN